MGDEEYCSFKKNSCPIPGSKWTCFKSDEKSCAMAVIIKEKQEKNNLDNQQEVSMAVIHSEFLGKCQCGEVLIKEGGEVFWTRSETVLIELSKSGCSIPEEKCPSCGGNPHVRIGSYYHPRFYRG